MSNDISSMYVHIPMSSTAIVPNVPLLVILMLAPGMPRVLVCSVAFLGESARLGEDGEEDDKWWLLLIPPSTSSTSSSSSSSCCCCCCRRCLAGEGEAAPESSSTSSHELARLLRCCPPLVAASEASVSSLALLKLSIA